VRRNLNEPERYQRCFADGWYLTGDLAIRDADGYLLVCRPSPMT
jgi:acetyl-CoA synthetase